MEQIVHIQAGRKFFSFSWKELLAYRDLIFLLVKREFISRYKQTILGPAWAILQPLLTTLVFTVLFGNFAHLESLDRAGSNLAVPAFLFYLSGTICWSLFSQILTQTSSTFIQNVSLLGKVYFPRMVIPISTAFCALISFAIQSALFLVMWCICRVLGMGNFHLTAGVLLIPVLILEIMLLAVGIGILICALTIKYRDLQFAVPFLVQLLQYAVPVCYGLALLPASVQKLILLNPFSVALTALRQAVFSGGFFSWGWFGISWLITLAVFFTGLFVFNYAEKTFMDSI